jgi:hypothetical protein
MGFRCQTISRNTLANANATRPWKIYTDFAQHLIDMARPLYATEPFGVELDAAVYAFDPSTIDRCLSGVCLGAVSPGQGGYQAAHAAGLEANAFFVTRAKSNTKFKRRYSQPVNRINTSVLCDQTGVLTSYQSSHDYPTTMRRVVIRDDTGKRLHLDHHSLYEVLQILSLSMFETIPINQLLTPPSTNSDVDF